MRNSGFSMLEVVLIGALSSIALFGILTMLSNLGRSQKSLTQSNAFENLATTLTMALRNPATCPAAFQTTSGTAITFPTSITVASPNLPTDGVSVSKIVIGSLTIDTSAAYNDLFVTSILLKQVTAGSPTTASPVPYTANLVLQGSKTKTGTPNAVGGGNLKKEIPISLTLSIPGGGGAPVLTACNTAGSGAGGGSTVPTWIPYVCNGTIAYSGWSSWCLSQGNRNPTQLCQAAGYTEATGACKGFQPTNSWNFFGTLFANDSGAGYSVGNKWAFACWYGNGMSYPPNQIACY